MTEDFYFLLLPEFSSIGFMSAIEPLRVANRFSGALYRWHILSADGGPVAASNGISLNAEGAFDSVKDASVVFVVAGFEPLVRYTREIADWLRRLDRAGATLGGIDTGSFILAEAGLLDRKRVTVHWEAASAFQERYPALEVSPELFEIDERRITCAGGTASIDLMLDVIARASWRGTGGAGFGAVRARTHPAALGSSAHADRRALWRAQSQADPGDRRDGTAHGRAAFAR